MKAGVHGKLESRLLVLENSSAHLNSYPISYSVFLLLELHKFPLSSRTPSSWWFPYSWCWWTRCGFT